jgi:hypothetical protein
MNEIVKSEPQLPLEAVDAWSAFLDEAPSLGPLLLFKKGKYSIGDNEIAVATEFIAHVSELARGWVKFGKDGVPPEYFIGLVRDGFKIPPRETMGSMDPKYWDKERNSGKPKDPFQRQYYLLLENAESGELCTFVTGSVGGEKAIRDLSRAYKPYAATTQLPIIALHVDNYKHPDHGLIYEPILKVMGWRDSGVTPPPPKMVTPKSQPAPSLAREKDAGPVTKTETSLSHMPAKGNGASDMDDDIPF